jgi:hypothetical protein
MRVRSINAPPGHPSARQCRIASTATGTTATTALPPGSGNRDDPPPGRPGRPGRIPDRRPGKVVTCPGRLRVAAAVTLPKDLLLTGRVVIITPCRHRRLVAGFRSAACPITERSRSGRYAITCNVITWQWITKVSPEFRLRTGQNANLLDFLFSPSRRVYGDPPGASQRTSMEVD